MLLLQHQSQLGVYAKSKECQPGVDPYSRLKYQQFRRSHLRQLEASTRMYGHLATTGMHSTPGRSYRHILPQRDLPHTSTPHINR